MHILVNIYIENARGRHEYRNEEMEMLKIPAKIMIWQSGRVAESFAQYFREGSPCLTHLLLLTGAAPLSQKEDHSRLNI